MTATAIAKPSTARKGDPLNASRGRAVSNAKEELADAIYDAVSDAFWTKKRIEWLNRLEFAYLGKLLGVSEGEARRLMKTATLGELREWISKVKK